MTFSLIRTLYFAYSYKCLNEVLCILIMLRSNNFQKLIKLHLPNQSEIIQLWNLSKRFYRLLKKTPISTTIDTSSVNKYNTWVRNYMEKKGDINMWNKIPISRDEFLRLHTNTDIDDIVPEFNYDDTALIAYLKGKTNITETNILSFTRSFVRNMTYIPLKCRKLKFGSLIDIKRSDNIEENIINAFTKGFPLNKINISGSKAQNINGINYTFTKSKHNILSPYGEFLHITYNMENEPDILTQIKS